VDHILHLIELKFRMASFFVLVVPGKILENHRKIKVVFGSKTVTQTLMQLKSTANGNNVTDYMLCLVSMM